MEESKFDKIFNFQFVFAFVVKAKKEPELLEISEAMGKDLIQYDAYPLFFTKQILGDDSMFPVRKEDIRGTIVIIRNREKFKT